MRDLQKEPLENLVPDKYTKKIRQYKKLEKEIKELEKTFKSYLASQMAECNVQNFTLDDVLFSYVKETNQITIDKDALKANEPDIFEKYAICNCRAATVKAVVKPR